MKIFGKKNKEDNKTKTDNEVYEQVEICGIRNLADALNYLYAGTVNGDHQVDITSPDFLRARTLLDLQSSSLESNVVEFLAVFMAKYPDGNVNFVASNKNLVDLICKYENLYRQIGFGSNGAIVEDKKYIEKDDSEKNHQGKGE